MGRILGIDPSLRGTGLAVLGCKRNAFDLLHSETLKLTNKVSSIDCLGQIHQTVAGLADLWKPNHVSCEETIYVQNFKTAQIMGSARGAALSAVAIREIPVFEYAPLRVKQAVVGFGRASKEHPTLVVSLEDVGRKNSAPLAEANSIIEPWNF